MTTHRISPVSATPISVIDPDTLRTHLRLEPDDEAVLLPGIIAAAQRQVADAAHLAWGDLTAFGAFTAHVAYDAPARLPRLSPERRPWPAVLRVPVRPLATVTALDWVADDGSVTAVPATDWQLLPGSARELRTVRLTGCWHGQDAFPWLLTPGSLRLTVTGGWATAAAVPPELTAAVLRAATALYSDRGDGVCDASLAGAAGPSWRSLAGAWAIKGIC